MGEANKYILGFSGVGRGLQRCFLEKFGGFCGFSHTLGVPVVWQKKDCPQENIGLFYGGSERVR